MRGYRFVLGWSDPPPPYGCLQFVFACWFAQDPATIWTRSWNSCTKPPLLNVRTPPPPFWILDPRLSPPPTSPLTGAWRGGGGGRGRLVGGMQAKFGLMGSGVILFHLLAHVCLPGDHYEESPNKVSGRPHICSTGSIDHLSILREVGYMDVPHLMFLPTVDLVQPVILGVVEEVRIDPLHVEGQRLAGVVQERSVRVPQLKQPPEKLWTTG